MTARLAAFAVTKWSEVDGVLQMESNIDLLDLPLDRAMNVLYTMVIRNRDEKERAKVESDLNRPMQGEHQRADDPTWGDEAQGAAFLAAMSGMES